MRSRHRWHRALGTVAATLLIATTAAGGAAAAEIDAPSVPTTPSVAALPDPATIPTTLSPTSLSWTSCSVAPGAQCASITVPRDWARPADSGTYRIGVARVRATDPARRIGILAFNPGGPGSRAVANLSWVLSLLPADIKARFDIVAVDPRGVGESQPWVASCSAPQPTPPATGPVDWLAWTRTFVGAVAKANRACLTKNADVAATVGTWQIVRDIDAVRRAMNERSITFWGMSYGTTVGRAYAQAFPSRTRALLLDGTISPVSSVRIWAEEHTYDDRIAIDTMVASLGPAYVRAHTRVMRALEKRAVTSPGGTLVTRWTVGRALVAWSSFHTTWGSAASLIKATRTALFAKTGDARSRGASTAAALLSGTTPTGQSNTLSPQWTYVNCADFPDRPTIAELAALAERGAASGGAGIGMAVLREGAQCAGLPRIGRPLTPMTTPLALRTPPIIANAKGDNRTPWTAALATQRAFPGSRIVGYTGTHHILYGRRTACINAPITTYLLTERLPAADILCPH